MQQYVFKDHYNNVTATITINDHIMIVDVFNTKNTYPTIILKDIINMLKNDFNMELVKYNTLVTAS